MRIEPLPADRRLRSTTILGVVSNGCAALGGDGQVTLGETILKRTARKIRRLSGGAVLAGFAGSAADGLTLFERFEAAMESNPGDLRRAAVTLAREWRTDRILRTLSAQLAVVDVTQALVITGSGDVIEPDDGIVAIGSGGPYAMAACRALRRHTDFDVARLVEESLKIASEVCIFTGGSLRVLSLPESLAESLTNETGPPPSP